MIKLAQPLDLNKYVSRVSLPIQNSQPRGLATLAGLGSTGLDIYKQHQYPKELRAINVTIIDTTPCDRVRRAHKFYPLPHGSFCTASSKRTASCFVSIQSVKCIIYLIFLIPAWLFQLTKYTYICSLHLLWRIVILYINLLQIEYNHT